jgi:polysaccharide deacetylase family protein (PEP-CTERM system associated)
VNRERITNALTIDVEDYYQVSAFADDIKPSQWDSFESRVVANTHRLLRLLARNEVTATFFVLGWVAERHPLLIHDIRSDGHEIACHSHWHQLVYDQDPEEFRRDLVRSRTVLEEVTGESVTLYRAPSFSITAKSLWAYQILAEEGFQVSSSIFPIHHDRYGIPDADPFPHQVSTDAGEVWEFPASVVRACGANLPVSGGGYFRLYPAWCTRLALQRINNWDRAFMFYLHPWEVDPDQPRLRGSMKSRFRHYVNLAATEAKLAKLLSWFEFSTMTAALEQERLHAAERLHSDDATEAPVAMGALSETIEEPCQ